jgi:hypothetical protein
VSRRAADSGEERSADPNHAALEHVVFRRQHARVVADFFCYLRHYGSLEEFYADLGETHRQAVCGFGEAGCRYLQLDEIWVTIGAPAGDGGRLLCRKLDCCW